MASLPRANATPIKHCCDLITSPNCNFLTRACDFSLRRILSVHGPLLCANGNIGFVQRQLKCQTQPFQQAELGNKPTQLQRSSLSTTGCERIEQRYDQASLSTGYQSWLVFVVLARGYFFLVSELCPTFMTLIDCYVSHLSHWVMKMVFVTWSLADLSVIWSLDDRIQWFDERWIMSIAHKTRSIFELHPRRFQESHSSICFVEIWRNWWTVWWHNLKILRRASSRQDDHHKKSFPVVRQRFFDPFDPSLFPSPSRQELHRNTWPFDQSTPNRITQTKHFGFPPHFHSRMLLIMVRILGKKMWWCSFAEPFWSVKIEVDEIDTFYRVTCSSPHDCPDKLWSQTSTSRQL